MTDRLDELQRLHDAVGKTRSAADRDARRLADYAYARFNLTNAAEETLPALLRVARAAAEFADDVFDYRFGGKTPCVDIGQLVSKWIDIRVEITKWSELRAALAELRGTDG